MKEQTREKLNKINSNVCGIIQYAVPRVISRENGMINMHEARMIQEALNNRDRAADAGDGHLPDHWVADGDTPDAAIDRILAITSKNLQSAREDAEAYECEAIAFATYLREHSVVCDCGHAESSVYINGHAPSCAIELAWPGFCAVSNNHIK